LNNIQNKRHRSFFFFGVGITSLIYIAWRIFFTIPFHFGLLSTIFGIALAAAEAIAVLEALSHYWNMSSSDVPEKPEIPDEMYPHVDILVATHSEEVDLLYKTLNGCLHLKYPDKSKIHIYLCDDTNRPEMRLLAEQMGVGYFGLSENLYAKAGNLNHALAETASPLVVTLDADMIPTSDMLLETVPYFFLPQMIKEDGAWRMRREDEIDPNEKIGFVQTPQSFYNADLFQFNLYAEKNVPNEQDYFFWRSTSAATAPTRRCTPAPTPSSPGKPWKRWGVSAPAPSPRTSPPAWIFRPPGTGLWPSTKWWPTVWPPKILRA